mgnify:CR=1 FL=1
MYVVAALYKFVALPDYVALRDALYQHLVLNKVKGTLLLAEEGINGTICGTREGITAFQLDLKIHGLPMSIAKEAIAQNKVSRDAILDIMAKTMPATRAELKPCAPRTHRIKIPSDKIGALIGPGGKNIKRITEYTGCQLDIDQDDSGWVTIFATDGESLARAVNEVNLLSAQIEINKTYKGIIRSVKEFGAFVECLPGQEGLMGRDPGAVDHDRSRARGGQAGARRLPFPIPGVMALASRVMKTIAYRI